MADADENRRTAHPTGGPKAARRTGGPNHAQLARAQTKYKVYDKAANTEYERLFPIDTKTKLNPNSNAAEHTIFFICAPSGTVYCLILTKMLFFECFYIHLIKRFSERQDIS